MPITTLYKYNYSWTGLTLLKLQCNILPLKGTWATMQITSTHSSKKPFQTSKIEILEC